GATPPVPVATIAGELDVSVVSANQMIRKLETSGFVDYLPYKGVVLTETGSERANVVLRNRRLWAVFLSEHLGLSPESADDVACEMEHVTPEEVAGRLSRFLGEPSIDPGGKPIPRSTEH
ncbi:MAG: metal-dependent transcriptional regulator, partial [Acidimicrobiia bacterium]